jgi:cold shock CspA family protein
MSIEAIFYGTILFHDRVSGFGFVVPDLGGPEIFFPTNEINLPQQQRWTVQKHQKVAYVLKPNTRNPEKGAFIAGNITPLDVKEPESTPLPAAPTLNASVVSLDNADGAL